MMDKKIKSLAVDVNVARRNWAAEKAAKTRKLEKLYRDDYAWSNPWDEKPNERN